MTIENTIRQYAKARNTDAVETMKGSQMDTTRASYNATHFDDCACMDCAADRYRERLSKGESAHTVYRHDRLREALVEAMSYNTDMPINEYERIRLLLEKIQPTE